MLATDVAIVAVLFVFRIVAGVFRVRLRIEEDEWGFGLLGERVDSADGRSINLILGGGVGCCRFRKSSRRCKQTNPNQGPARVRFLIGDVFSTANV